ncbi:MAG TPA: CAP domain-containing protein [Woeseiaceae bacterium]|nr:CAP domain-containing protein [Woeseiaceae bacterium]
MSLSARHAAALLLALLPAPLLLADGSAADPAGHGEGPLDYHGDDAVVLANALRISGCGDRPAVAAPLVPDRRLDAAAARVAAGEGLQEAASAAGYRAARVARIRVVNASGAAYTSILESEFCALLGDPEFTDVGLYRAGDETWLVLAAPLSLAGGVGASGAAEALFAAINAARSVTRRCGGAPEYAAAPPLERSAALDAAALLHARDIALRGALGHDGADGSTAAERVARAGYRWSTVGENVAAGQRQPEETVDTWLASPGHCKNLMDPRFRDTGVAVAVNEDDDRVIYWVQVYAAPQ